MDMDVTDAPHIAIDDMFLVGLLLDANRTKDGWQYFLDAFRKHFNVHSCHLYIAEVNTMAGRFQEFSGPHPTEWQLKEYMEKYFETDYTHLAILRGRPNEWFASNLMPNREELEAAPVFTQWAIPNGIHCVAGATLFRDGIWSCVFVHNRGPHHGEYTSQEIERCRALTPYIEKAIRLRIELAERNKDRSRLRSVLNQFRLPAATLNEFGEVIAKNIAMDEFLENQANVMLFKDKHFHLLDNKNDKQLQMGIAQTVSIAKGRELSFDNDAINIDALSGNLTIGLQELIEIGSKTNEVFVGAMIYVASAGLLRTISASNLQSLFKLSRAEAQCCHLFCKGMTLKAIAAHEQKSINTVREQIQNSYQKTGTNSQLGLINLLAGLPV